MRSLDDQIHKQDYKVLSINIEIHNDAWQNDHDIISVNAIYYEANIKQHIYVGGPNRMNW